MAIYHESEAYGLGRRAALARNIDDPAQANALADQFRELRDSVCQPGDANRIALNACYMKGMTDNRVIDAHKEG